MRYNVHGTDATLYAEEIMQHLDLFVTDPHLVVQMQAAYICVQRHQVHYTTVMLGLEGVAVHIPSCPIVSIAAVLLLRKRAG